MTARTVPTMPTWLAGQKVTAALLNQVGAYGVFWADPPMFRMYQGSAQSVGNGAYVQITCDTSETDTETGRAGTTPYSYVIPAGQGGRWTFTGVISWAGNAAGIRIAAIFKNGSQINGANAAAMAGPGANTTNVVISATVAVNAGDVIGLYGYQSSGGALSTQIGGAFPSVLEGRLVSLGTP